ncbi:MAG: TPM domain-containing protein, partial [Planctomycetes bacterium]|nr:TPM domain-containing protein [Planctomycetota bacterium]
MKFHLLALLFALQEFPAPTGYVVDTAGVIQESQRRALESVVRDLDRQTGAQLAVAVVSTVKPMEIRQYALELAERWNVGKRGEDTGVLIVVAIQDREYSIEVGYGLEDVLPDGFVGELGRDYFVPLFQEGRYGEGIVNVSAAIIGRIAGKYGVTIEGAPEPVPVRRRGRGCGPFLGLIFLMLVFTMMLGRRGGGFFPLLLMMGM